MLKKLTSFLFFAVATAWLTAAPTVLVWDFTKGLSDASGSYPMQLKGTAKQSEKGLECGIAPRNVQMGARLAKKAPEVGVGAIKLTVEFTLNAGKNTEAFDFIWDSKGDYYDRKSTKPIENSGFTIGFYNRSGSDKTPNRIRPQAWLGFGDATGTAYGKYVDLLPNVKHTMIFAYDGQGKASFTIDGVLNSEITLPNGKPLASPLYIPTVGDRAVGNFIHFNGIIHTLKLEYGNN